MPGCVQLPTHNASRWKIIGENLTTLSKQPSVTNLENAILSHRPCIKDEFTFSLKAFGELVNCEYPKFWTDTLPFICSVALRLPSLFATQDAAPLLLAHKNATVSLTREQILSLLANSFLCTIESQGPIHQLPMQDFHFANILSSGSDTNNEYHQSQKAKVQCVLHYFTRMCHEQATENRSLNGGNDVTQIPSVVTFTRQVLTGVSQDLWLGCTDALIKLVPKVKPASIDTEKDATQVDFANAWIGGGVLEMGAALEEIFFVTQPELLVSLLFTVKLEDEEALLVSGHLKYSQYTGYVQSFTFVGDNEDNTPLKMCAIDATPFFGDVAQYEQKMLHREAVKALAGFKGSTTVATGNWGCGAFGGDAQLKALLQWIAATVAGCKELVYCVWDNEPLAAALTQLQQVQGLTVGKLWTILLKFEVSKPEDERSVMEYVMSALE
eukprot:TRINITY_DN67455_c1_g1_i1.p1 TRINITY_DN67455_c1_g1~~TRINITY_DN67455_c1_g1_i1.p1  ORF type:complete len:440 (-),score=37.22 TRINITY_DN67455_c1_g1_i1:78-1397(-)